MDNQVENAKPSSELLFEKMTSSRNSLRRENAKLVKIVCDQMEKDGGQIRIIEVAKRCFELFGKPSRTTVTNTSSEIGEYIRLRSIEQQARLSKSSHIPLPLSMLISDPGIAAEVQFKENQIKVLTRENNTFRHLFMTMKGIDIDEVLKNKSTLEALTKIDANKSQTTEIDLILQNVLLKIMDHLVDRGYSFYSGRFVLNSKVILNQFELRKIREVTGLTTDEWDKRYGIN